MTIKQLDTDASPTTAQSENVGPGDQAWVSHRLAVERTDEPWQSTTPSGALVRRQFVFVPSPNPWDSVGQAREAMDAGAPRVLRLRPGSLGHRFPLVDWALEPLPAVCERDGWTLALDYGPSGAIPLGDIATFACSAPEVPLLVLGDKLCEYPAIWRLLDRCPNILLQVTNRAAAEDISAGVATFGKHRFVFGSRGLGGGSDANFAALLDDEARRAVVSENACHLDALNWREKWL